MKRIVLAAILLVFNGSIVAQRLFNITYTDEKNVEYECFMVHFNPHDIYMRIKFAGDSGTDNVVHVNYTSITGIVTSGIDAGKQYMLLKADPQTLFVKGDTAILESFIPNYFLWFPQETTDKKKGPFITRDEIDLTIIGKTTKYYQYKPKFTEADLLEFFNKDEASFEYLKEMTIAAIAQGRSSPIFALSDTLHFIMAANTSYKAEGKIGPSCKVDLDHLKAEFKSIATQLGMKFKQYLIVENDFSKSKLIARLNEIQPGKNDVVVFSYSGHGSRWKDQADSLPFMNLWIQPPYENAAKDTVEYKQIFKNILYNSMTMKEVYDKIVQKNARLNIVLGDLCNSAYDMPRPTPTKLSYELSRSNAKPIRNLQKMADLFVSAKGNILSVATKPFQTAGFDSEVGGFFTAGFIDALELSISFLYTGSSPKWDTILSQTIKKATEYRDQAGYKSEQTGLLDIQVNTIK